MAKQLEDTTTAEMFDIQPKLEENLLARDFNLVKVSAYIKDEKKAKKKTATAERQERHRQKLKEAKLVKASIPEQAAAEIKAAGTFESWLETKKTIHVEKLPVYFTVEKIIEVPAVFSSDELRLLSKGRAVESLTGWRRFICKKLLGV